MIRGMADRTEQRPSWNRATRVLGLQRWMINDVSYPRRERGFVGNSALYHGQSWYSRSNK